MDKKHSKITVETALNAEQSPRVRQHEPSTGSDARNGCSSKTVINDGEFELETPCDREGSF